MQNFKIYKKYYQAALAVDRTKNEKSSQNHSFLVVKCKLFLVFKI